MHGAPGWLPRWASVWLKGSRVRCQRAAKLSGLHTLESRTLLGSVTALLGSLTVGAQDKGMPADAPASASTQARMPGGLPAVRAPRVRPLAIPSTRHSPTPQSAGYRSPDGSGNNLADPNWGQAGTDLLRLAPVGYADGISAPSLPQDQSARAISNILNNQADPKAPSQDLNTVDQQSLSRFGYAFGQFLDHDLDFTPAGGASFPIPVAPGDPIGPSPLPFTRSQFDPTTGTDDPRQQINAVTSFLDLSQVYGSDAATADALRTHVDGQLKTSPGGMLPYDNANYFTAPQLTALNQSVGGMENQGPLPTADLFATGDTRGNENVELMALQTLFVRNHNRIASELRKGHPGWSDEQLYQEARKINIAEYQSIIYNEWMPAVLGPNALPAYTGYNPNVNAGIATEFSTVAFRFGHSMVNGQVARQDNQGLGIVDIDPSGAAINLAQDFFDTNLLSAGGAIDPLTGHTASPIDAILKGDADGTSQAMDPMAVNEVRNLLFGNAGAGGQDLIALDIQRGRDNGLPDYNTVRVAYGLPPVTSFAQITSNVQVQQELQQAYGSVNNIDALEGGLAEDHVPGSDLGPLFQAILVDQFSRLRDGDRFFYLDEPWSPAELRILRQGNTLAKVIKANTGVTNLQSDVFVFQASIGGTVASGHVGSSRGTSSLHGKGARAAARHGLPGITVALEDTSGTVLATAVTDGAGRYSFDQLTGLSGTGIYTVRLVLPTGYTQTSTNPARFLISRGDINRSGVDFVLARAR